MPATMRAVGYTRPLPVSDPECLVDAELPVPDPGPRDLLVRVRAVSVNPVDVKVRGLRDPHGLRVLGYDASGVVEAVGSDVRRFAPGDEVFYAGSIARQGSDAELQAVHENVVARKPASLDHTQAAALPLTAITAWEMLFDHLRLDAASEGTLLVVGGAGGVGSVAIQLARLRTRVRVIATASRPESRAWVRELGAHETVPGRAGLAEEVRAVAPDGVDHVLSLFSAGNERAFAEVLRPFGHVVAADDAVDISPLKAISAAWHWQYMFTRPVRLPDDDSQHRMLTEVARHIDAGELRPTAGQILEGLDAATLREAHRLVETSATIGKVVIGW